MKGFEGTIQKYWSIEILFNATSWGEGVLFRAGISNN